MHMVYVHNKEWTLFTRSVKLRGGMNQQIYYFSRRKPRSGRPTDMPHGYKVGVNRRTGLPYLRKG